MGGISLDRLFCHRCYRRGCCCRGCRGFQAGLGGGFGTGEVDLTVRRAGEDECASVVGEVEGVDGAGVRCKGM